jgi:hypothetical protein
MADISVSFGNVQRSNDDITAGWIAEQQHSRERAGVPVCAIVRVQGPDVNVSLSAGDCGPAGGGGRQPNPRELEILELWRRLHLGGTDFSPGNLQAFVKQTMRLS